MVELKRVGGRLQPPSEGLSSGLSSWLFMEIHQRTETLVRTLLDLSERPRWALVMNRSSVRFRQAAPWAPAWCSGFLHQAVVSVEYAEAKALGLWPRAFATEVAFLG